MKRLKTFCAVSLSIFLLFNITIFAGTTGKVSGKVTDASTGEPVFGANIVVEGTYFGAAADFEGDFIISTLPPGNYRLIVSAIGYNKVTVENVFVKIDLTTRVDVKLSPESIMLGEVVVQAEQPLITKDLTSTSAIITSDEIKMLPVDDFGQLVNLQAGVVDGHFRGGRKNEVAYLIDGIAINDVYNGELSVEIENNSIRQLEVISGTFNAEYGQAMSGVVNIVTKDGSAKFEGGVSAYVGNYFTTSSDIFENLNKANLSGPRDIQFNLSGPTPLKDLTFFLTARYYRDEGFIYGKRVYNTYDFFPFMPTGDGEYVPMNPTDKKSFNGKISYGISSWKISYSVLWDDNWNKYYDHGFRWTPDGIQNHYRTNTINTLQISFYPTQNTLSTLKFSSNRHKFWGHLYDNPFDSRYVEPNQGAPITSYTYRSGGNQVGRYDRYTWTNLAQWALESQIAKEHKIKLGAEGKIHEMYNHYMEIQNLTKDQLDDDGNAIFTLGYSDPGTKFNHSYLRRPKEFAAYIQDKMEYDIMIINAGVRFDYFDPNASLPVDLRNPLNNPNFPGAFQTRPAEKEYQISPRFGVSFPMSDQGAIHFSYGHFFQIPSFENLYVNSQYLIDQTTNVNSYIGNPELKAQKTVKYELGLQQVIFPNVSLDLTVYYSDIRNLLGMEILETYEGFLYARFANKDYGNVKGLIVTVDKRFVDFFSAKLDYTYQVASGNSSDPFTVFNNNRADPPVEVTKKVLPLNWDQTSTLNLSVTIGNPFDWTAGLIFSYGSGLPYTESARYTKGLRFENMGRKPTTYNVDLRANKVFKLYGLDFNIFLLVYNLLDIKNEYGVSATTGRAGIDLEAEEFSGTIVGLNTKEEYLRNPGDYSMPRQINFGINIGF